MKYLLCRLPFICNCLQGVPMASLPFSHHISLDFNPSYFFSSRTCTSPPSHAAIVRSNLSYRLHGWRGSPCSYKTCIPFFSVHQHLSFISSDFFLPLHLFPISSSPMQPVPSCLSFCHVYCHTLSKKGGRWRGTSEGQVVGHTRGFSGVLEGLRGGRVGRGCFEGGPRNHSLFCT